MPRMTELEAFIAQLKPQNRVVVEQVAELYRAGYIDLSGSQALVRKHTDLVVHGLPRKD